MSPSSSLPRAFVALAALVLLAGCEANTAPAGKAERPVKVQRVVFENEAPSPRIRRRGAGALRD